MKAKCDPIEKKPSRAELHQAFRQVTARARKIIRDFRTGKISDKRERAEWKRVDAAMVKLRYQLLDSVKEL